MEALSSRDKVMSNVGVSLGITAARERLSHNIARAVVLVRFGINWRSVPCDALWSLANFQAVFGDLTGEDARPTLWRGRPRPR